jgi:dolichyl-phosphate-mannose-protein mannosyltransferase
MRIAFVSALLVIQAGLLGWIGWTTSPTLDEVGHLPAGLYVWRLGRFDVYRVNPPLVRTLAATPAVIRNATTDWNAYRSGLTQRPEWELGSEFVDENGGSSALWYFTLARWMCIPICIGGGYVCWRWARELYGDMSGLVALALWCLSPNVLAWGSTICPDAAAAALGVAACYFFWRWLNNPNWPRVMTAGVFLGLALLTKTTWVLFFACYPLLWIAWCWGQRGSLALARHQGPQMGSVLLLGLLVLNVGYGFENSFKRLGDFEFASRTLAGEDSLAEGGRGGNRFRTGLLADLPVPVPENYVTGMDLQKSDFEEGKWSYLFGEWKLGGWWYYYLVCAVLKVPLGTWILGIMAVVLTAGSCAVAGRGRAYSAGWRNELAVLLPAVFVLVLVSSQTGFSRYFRYVLPCLPFVFIWISKVARSVHLKHRGIATIAGAAVLWMSLSSLSHYPHSMSYFNEIAGGPKGGHRFLVDANIDWGQDLFHLKRWLDAHPEAKPLHLNYYGYLDAEHFDIDHVGPPPVGLTEKMRARGFTDDARELGPQPGWHAISIHRIHDQSGKYLYFLNFEPVAMAGYSIYIYDIGRDEANRVRKEIGLTPL